MKQEKKKSVKIIILNLFFLIIPTVVINYFLFKYINDYFEEFSVNITTELLVFAGSILLSYILYSFRIRFLLTFPIIIIAIFVAFQYIGDFYKGEFDYFISTVQYVLYSVIFVFAWLLGFGFVKFRYFSGVMAVLILFVSVVLFSDEINSVSVEEIIIDFTPILLYSSYIIYINEILRSIEEFNRKSVIGLFNRTFLFFFIMAIIFFVPLFLFTSLFDDANNKINEQLESKQNSSSLLNKQPDSSYDLDDVIKLLPELKRSNKFMFTAFVNNYFDKDKKYPNSIYFRRHILTKYNASNESFEKDTLFLNNNSDSLPKSDLFMPVTGNLPYGYFERNDSIKTYSRGNKDKKNIEVEVYLDQLSDISFVAPSTAYYCKRTTFVKDTLREYKSAYICSTYVSEYNSGIMFYNFEKFLKRNNISEKNLNPAYKKFKDKHEKALSSVKNYNSIDSIFMKYYTNMPQGFLYDSITNLAKTIAKDAKTPFEKLSVVHAYFNKKDKYGERLFTYSLEPGNPPNPEDSKIYYFLFENRKGYCTYFAASTLFILRALNIPARMAVGFMTVDRSDKNKGWYWFYGDQAHAWVEVYFPGYGWLDFDTTVECPECEESDHADGTPPIQQDILLSMSGKITEILPDSQVIISPQEIVVGDNKFRYTEQASIQIDVKNANISNPDGAKSFSYLGKNDSVLSLVNEYNPRLKKIARKHFNDSLQLLTALTKQHIKINELYILPKQEIDIKPPDTPSFVEIIKTHNYLFYWVLIGITILLLLLPSIFYLFLKIRINKAKQIRKKSYRIYYFSFFYFNQLGYKRNDETPFGFANETIDNKFNTHFSDFMNVYLKCKYSKYEPTNNDNKKITDYYNEMLQNVKSKIKLPERIWSFVNFIQFFRFLNSFKRR